jgi:hypothetical protein
MVDMNVIHISWDGPYTPEEAQQAFGNADYGVYQIYGTHDASGPDTLLYIGQADTGPFGPRIADHNKRWARWNATEVTVYLGRLAGTASIAENAWGVLIDKAEAVLIYKVGVPYNEKQIRSLKYDAEPIIIVNHGRRHRLPECLSTISEFVNTDLPEFKVFDTGSQPQAAASDA